MPYEIKPFKRGFRVCDDKGKCLSKRPLTKTMARKQEIAVALSEHRKTGKPTSFYFK